jgi:tetratricopeptide (TPR) repeat protein
MPRSCVNSRLSFAQQICSSLLVICFAATASAQRGGMNAPPPLGDSFTVYNTAPGTCVLIFTVYAERNPVHLDRQALLKLVNTTNQQVTWQTTEDTSQAVMTNVPWGIFDVEVSAVGYLTAHQEVRTANSLRPAQIDIVLQRDPAAINLDVANTVMSPKARKEAKHAISLLKSNNLAAAQKQLDEAYKLAPSSADLNFLLGYLYFQKKDYAQAGTYLGTASNLSPHNAQALTLLGRTGLEREDYPAARSALEQAVIADADNWVPHNLLADAYLKLKVYDKARDEAQVAITRGKTAASPAQLVLGQALVGLGNDHDGIQALNTFLDQSPENPIAGQVRTLIAELKTAESKESSISNSAPSPAISPTQISGVDPLAAVSAPTLSVKSWRPPGVDDIKPAIAPAVECPSAQVIEESGKRVQDLVDNVARFAAVEDMFHQALDNFGIPVRTETRKYNYVASITEPQTGILLVDEYRTDKLELSGYPDQIASIGFAAMALIFHPHMRDNFAMICEGLGDWHGQATWLVHFRQRDDRPSRMQSYKIGNQDHTVGLKGRAWITADKFQIVRIEAEMVKPMPEIQLLSEHQVVEYGPVPFPRKNTTLWLPKNVEIYLDFRKHRYYRRHSLDHYMLYSVDTQEKRKEPGTAAQPDDANEKKPSA